MDVGGAKGGVKSDINVTPLVDVMLVLLIIMMIVAPLLQKGADVKLPLAANTAEKPETQDQTVVAVDKTDRYFVNGLPVRKVMQVNFISYAFNLNLGSLIGGVAFRYRMYSRLGLATATITRVLTLSMLTNWLGYLMLAGLVFTIAPLALPPDWKLDSEGLRLLGVALLGGRKGVEQLGDARAIAARMKASPRT
jgi:hypothetical protein